ncbi:MAG TPA: hypothetical protein VIO38_11830, partial [Rariglobus sp.]
MSAKILLVRTGSAVFHAQALITTASGLYDREIPDEAVLGAMLQAEKFDLVVCDGRQKNDQVLELVERIRNHQHDAHILLLCAKPQLDFIVKAIRFGVRDLFHPPVNLAALLARSDELLKPSFAVDTGAFLRHCRSSLTLFLAEDGDAPRPQAALKAGAADDRELKTLRAECDRLGRELQELTDKQHLAHATSASRAKELAERELALSDAEAALEEEKTRQTTEQESIREARAELEAAQAAAGQSAATLVAREQALVESETEHAKAMAAHEEIRAEFEASEQMLAAREKTLAADRKKFEAAQKDLPREQARLAEERAALAQLRETIEANQAAQEKARAEFDAQQARLAKEVARIEAESEALTVREAEARKLSTDVARREKAVSAQLGKLVEREQNLLVNEDKIASLEVEQLEEQTRL